MTVPTQVRIDADIKRESKELFKLLGMDLSTAINIFLHQCVIKGGLPFAVDSSLYNEETQKAIKEAKTISKNPKAKRYHSMKELKDSLD